MTKVLILLVIAMLLLGYIMQGRAWLKRQSWAAGFFAWIEPIEIALWRKSETILFARVLMLVGLIPSLLEQLNALNIPEIANLLPEQYRGYWTLTFAVIGILVEFNRRYTTMPLSQVAAPDAEKPGA